LPFAGNSPLPQVIFRDAAAQFFDPDLVTERPKKVSPEFRFVFGLEPRARVGNPVSSMVSDVRDYSVHLPGLLLESGIVTLVTPLPTMISGAYDDIGIAGAGSGIAGASFGGRQVIAIGRPRRPGSVAPLPDVWHG
jgi:hypothetical protein